MSVSDRKSSWTAPPAEGERRAQLYRLKWYPSSTTTKKAVFHFVNTGDHAVLDYITTIHTRQRGESVARRDDDPDLDDVPAPLLAMMRADGAIPTEEVEGR